MINQPTKYYSNRQEHTIANYLGWSVVSGSGARSFHPGDIKSEEFLGECKTHMKYVDTISLFIDVWAKICDEAVSAFRKPILFVDNGTQTVDNTWCVVPKSALPSYSTIVEIPNDSVRLSYSAKKLSFKHTHMQDTFSTYSTNNKESYPVVPAKLGNTHVLILTLSEFHKIIEEVL